LVERENLVCSATSKAKVAVGILQLWFNYFVAFFKVLAYAFLDRVSREVSRQLVHSLLSPFLCMGMITPVCQSFGAHPEHQEWTLYSGFWAFQIGFHHKLLISTFIVLTAKKHMR